MGGETAACINTKLSQTVLSVPQGHSGFINKRESQTRLGVIHMITKQQWFLIETEQEYEKVTARYEEIKDAPKGTPEHKEKLLLVHFISEYENKQWDLPEVDSIE